MTWGYIKQIWELQGTILYYIYSVILCFRYFGGWTPMNIHLPAIWMFTRLPGFWPMMWFEWVDLTTCTLLWRLPVPFVCTASIGCRFQTLCVKNRALCWTRGPFKSFADTNCNRFRTDTLQGGYGYTSQPFRKSWHGIVQVYSISQFWTICHWCFVFGASRSTGFQDRISLLHFLFKVVLLFSHSMRNFEPYHSLVPPQLSLASLSHFVPASWSCPASCPNGGSIEPNNGRHVDSRDTSGFPAEIMVNHGQPKNKFMLASGNLVRCLLRPGM